MKKKSFAIIGDPIAHSLSPVLHNYWFNKYKWPIIDVTRRSVEEIAASILKIFEIKKNK